jgi:hypothetical protein
MIPITIIDDFLENPNLVVDFANSLEYQKDEQGRWPGKRSNYLFLENQMFFHSFCIKLFSIFFDINDNNIKWEVDLYFQKINSVFKEGWIHQDTNALFTAILYLNKNNNSKSGTSIMSKKTLTPIIPQEEKQRFILSETETQKTKSDLENLNNSFEDSVSVYNKYNRIVIFPSHLYHKAQSFEHNEDRLTLIAFVKKLYVPQMPLQNMKRIII